MDVARSKLGTPHHWNVPRRIVIVPGRAAVSRRRSRLVIARAIVEVIIHFRGGGTLSSPLSNAELAPTNAVRAKTNEP